MKKTYTQLSRRDLLRALSVTLVLIFIIGWSKNSRSQIYEPEGINMPGSWNAWTNPPANNLALASSTQVSGGKIEKIDNGTLRWQTILKVKATGGDLTAGTYPWLFTSGPATSAFQNKWSAVNVIIDSLQTYTKEGSTDNSITLEDNYYYTMNWEDAGYVNTRAIFMKTSGEPVEVDSVSIPTTVLPNTPVQIAVKLSGPPSPEEKIYVRYSTDAWVTSTAIKSVQITGNMAYVDIPGQATGTVVSYYAFTSSIDNIQANYDLLTIFFNNNEGANYSFTVVGTVPAISFANLQWPQSGMILPGVSFEVYGQVYIPFVTGQSTPAPGLQAWVGYNGTDTDPSTWTNWVSASFNGPSGNNDEFKADIGSVLTSIGTYYYTTRFKYNNDPYVYGGYSATGGGYWNGTTNISGKVDVVVGINEPGEIVFRIYPNPASDLIFISLKERATVQLFDMTGKRITVREFSDGDQSLDISALKPGIFHLQISAGNKISHRSIVKE
jgi:hypothetical protein